MKKGILIAALVVVVVLIGSIVGGVVWAAGPNQASFYPSYPSSHRLFGVVDDGAISMPPEDSPPYYAVLADIIITNPDLQYSKTIQRVVICDGDNGVVVKEIIPTGDEALLDPQEVWDTDFRMLEVPGLVARHIYTINVYWTGRGEKLLGYIEPLYLEAEQDEFGEWHAVGVAGGMSRQMQYYSR